MARFRCRPYDQGHDDRQQFQRFPLVYTRAARTRPLIGRSRLRPPEALRPPSVVTIDPDRHPTDPSLLCEMSFTLQPAKTANEDVEEIREIVDGMTYCAVTPEAPEWHLNLVFKTVLGAEDDVSESLCSDHPLFFADHFLRVLKDDAPPPSTSSASSLLQPAATNPFGAFTLSF
ncbi:hypothetical protein CcaCcLH18_04936 [Colletotrichum camelliae]|nr:hypothetical protein CcaCcLH18_04936 [Colletotrichum camelliae]